MLALVTPEQGSVAAGHAADNHQCKNPHQVEPGFLSLLSTQEKKKNRQDPNNGLLHLHVSNTNYNKLSHVHMRIALYGQIDIYV
jgi:hypothetical protein